MPGFDNKLDAILAPILQNCIQTLKNTLGENKRLLLSNLLLMAINPDNAPEAFNKLICSLPEQAKQAIQQLHDLYWERCREDDLNEPIVQIVSIRYLVETQGQRYEQGAMQHFVKWNIEQYCKQLLKPCGASCSAMTDNNAILANSSPASRSMRTASPTFITYEANSQMDLQQSLNTLFLLSKQQGVATPPAAANAMNLFEEAARLQQAGHYKQALLFNDRALAFQHHYPQEEQIDLLLQRTEILIALGIVEEAESCLNLANQQIAQKKDRLNNWQIRCYPN